MIRIREAKEPSGMISENGAERKYGKYGISRTTLREWVMKGEVKVARWPQNPGEPKLLDEDSLLEHIKLHRPHQDNQRRRLRTHSLVATAPAGTRPSVAPSGNGHGVRFQAHSLVDRMAAPIARGQAGQPVLSTREWVDRFYAEQARSMGGAIRPQTRESYDWTFKERKMRMVGGSRRVETFMETFPTIPMDPVNPTPGQASQARRQILEYLHGLRNQKTSMSLAPGSKQLALRILATFYHWLAREHGFKANVPDLTNPDLPTPSAEKHAYTQDEIRRLLALCRQMDEKAIVITMAQTGCRRGELCSLDPDHPGRALPSNPACACCGPQRRKGRQMLTSAPQGGGWVHVYGKPTRANKSGKRIMYLPSESLEALGLHLSLFQRISWKMLPLTEIRLADWLRWLQRQAGMYEQGQNSHAFRRAFEAEFLRNGGSELVMDELLGHRKVDMRSLYFNMPLDEALEQANKFAPRRFLQKELPGLEQAS